MNRRHNNSIGVAVAAGIAAVAALTFAPAAASEPLAPPTAALTASPAPADVGEIVSFSGAASTGDGAGSSIARYEWDLDGDGDFEVSTGGTPSTSRAYAESGTVAVRLRVTDNEGDIDEASIALRVNAGPTAGFIYEPSTPSANERVIFSSTSRDPDGQIPPSGYQWDFDGDGEFDEAVGETVTVSFPRAGVTTVGLRVTDSDGATNARTRKVKIAQPRLLSPFPIVRLLGEVRSGGSTEINRLTVRGPQGSEVGVSCAGESCPFREQERTIRRRRVKFPEIEGRLLPGSVVQIFVTQPERTGKFTSFRFRDGAAPKRRDRCLAPGSREPISCPSS